MLLITCIKDIKVVPATFRIGSVPGKLAALSRWMATLIFFEIKTFLSREASIALLVTRRVG